MSARKRKAPDSMEQACMLCRRAEADPDIYGEKLEKQGLCVHVFCLFFANKLFQQPVKETGLMGFLPEDIRRTIARAAQKGLLCSFQHCFVCGESGATITCRETGCDRSFHLPCAVEGGCVTQFLPQYRSFCWEHRPEQAVEAAPEENTTCLICLELVGDRKSYSTMVCPACKHAWFHRGCIQVGAVPWPPGTAGAQQHQASLTLLMFLLQGQAVRAGISCFQCPLCRDKDLFLSDMLVMGIRIPSGWCPSARLTRQESASAVPCQGLPQQSWPSAVPCLWASASRRSWKQGRGGRARTPCVRLMPGQQGLIKFPSSFRRPSWENGHAYAGLSERHSRCDASECLCPGGREHAEEEGPWQLLLCCSCAAEGTHRRCSYSRNSTARWECDGCAGLGTGKRQSIRVPLGSGCPGWAWQSLSAPGGPGPPLWPILPRGLGSRALDLPASVTASSASSELAGPSTAS
ncbi:LOW QUALITY PROTEIN: PHD finger protein 7-like [Ciconia maguari]